MTQWIKKISAIFITVLTLGMYIPPTILPTNAETNKDDLASKSDYDALYAEQTENVDKTIDLDGDLSIPSTDAIVEADIGNDTIVQAITEQAQTYTLQKLGPKITNQIETEFMINILPVMENVISDILTHLEHEAPYIEITEKPTKGYGERIFNLYDHTSKQDIARFDVRRDNRPQEGYWFNFHYHLYKDNFEQHYEIGDIYWHKNTPPKWMSS